MRTSEPQDLLPAEKASLTSIERLAKEVLRQCGYLRQNGRGDLIRFGFVHLNASELEAKARRAFRRWEQEREWERQFETSNADWTAP